MSKSNSDGALKSHPKSGDWSGGTGLLPFKELGPIFLMTITPIFSIVFYHVVANMDGNFIAFGRLVMEQGLVDVLRAIWPSPWDREAWQMILSFMAFEAILQKYMPGKRFEASLTPKGNIPVYTANGVASYLTTLGTFLVLTHFGIIKPYRVYDKFGNILSSLNVFAYGLCTVLWIKGNVAPSTTDSGTNGSWIYDFYWGMDLYPNILGWDVKMFTNCRCGMIFWAVGTLCFAHKNMQLNGGELQLAMAINVALQLIYVTKFFYWEMGYMCSMDIQHDRAGYYLCWGCLVWIPGVYVSHSFFLTEHAPDLSPATGLAIFLAGVFMIWTNYESDNQRYIFRQTKGSCTIFGKTPKYIVAKYTTSQGTIKESLLLLDGFWKISRHFHYVPEILASLCWSLPALNSGLVGPYFYVFYLTILLTDRAFRDDDRCRKKYTEYWADYCKEVPYMIVPGIL